MGFVEETGAAQHFRDARIAPIYEGTNGIQAADLVGRKLSLGNDEPLDRLLADIRADAGDEPGLVRLADACADVTQWMRGAGMDDRLAGSADFLVMLATATAGWQLLRQLPAASAMIVAKEGDPAFLKAKQATARFLLDRVVPEAVGHAAGTTAGGMALFAVSSKELRG